MIKRDLFVTPIKIRCVFTLIQQEELMGWHSSGVKRTRIQVIGVNFSDFLDQEKGN